MNAKVITEIIAFCIATTGMGMANMFLIMMIGEINRKRQEGNLVSYFGFTFPKIVRIFEEYRRIYPGGKLHIYAWTGFVVGMSGMLIVAVCLGILG